MKKVFLALALVGSLSFGNEGEKMTQEIVRAGSLGGFKGDSKIFSGEVKVSVMFKPSSWQNFGGGLVEFSQGARSAWHTHPAGQTLIVTEGSILTGVEGGEVSLAKKGDVILCPPNVKHWHGATDRESGTHIALTHQKDGSNVVWLEKVSDAEYKEALGKIQHKH